jgi:hypothetical protein
MYQITSRVDTVIEKLFPAADRSTVHQILLEECSDKLPLVKNSNEIERIQLGILKLSMGNVNQFLEAAHMARRDWRDVLVAAGFGNDLEAHNNWAAEVCK